MARWYSLRDLTRLLPFKTTLLIVRHRVTNYTVPCVQGASSTASIPCSMMTHLTPTRNSCRIHCSSLQFISGIEAWGSAYGRSRQSTNSSSTKQWTVPSVSTPNSSHLKLLYDVAIVVTSPAPALQACALSHLVAPRGSSRLADPARCDEHRGQMA